MIVEEGVVGDTVVGAADGVVEDTAEDGSDPEKQAAEVKMTPVPDPGRHSPHSQVGQDQAVVVNPAAVEVAGDQAKAPETLPP